MTKTSKSLISAATALVAMAALPALAQQAAPQSAAPKAKATVARTADALTVVRDADTGQLRAPTADELAGMQGTASAYSAAQSSTLGTATRLHISGATGVRLTNEMMHSSVMVRNADGSFSAMCVGANGVPHAAHALQTAQPVASNKLSKLETE